MLECGSELGHLGLGSREPKIGRFGEQLIGQVQQIRRISSGCCKASTQWHRDEEWREAVAGQRVELIKPDPRERNDGEGPEARERVTTRLESVFGNFNSWTCAS